MNHATDHVTDHAMDHAMDHSLSQLRAHPLDSRRLVGEGVADRADRGDLADVGAADCVVAAATR